MDKMKTREKSKIEEKATGWIIEEINYNIIMKGRLLFLIIM